MIGGRVVGLLGCCICNSRGSLVFGCWIRFCRQCIVVFIASFGYFRQFVCLKYDFREF